MNTTGFAGTWRLVPEKSDIPPATRSQVLDIETDGVRLTMRETLVNDKGEALMITVEAVRVTYESVDGEGGVQVNRGYFERVESE